jgi:hypothetical protein
MSKENTSTKRTFVVDGTTYAVRRPTVLEIRLADERRSLSFNKALQRGDLLREQLDTELRKRELWNDARENEYQGLRNKVVDSKFKLEKGGIKLSEAKEIALEMSDTRAGMVSMLGSRSELDSNTCEGKADSARFNSLFSSCLVYEESGEVYFKGGLDEYLEKQEDNVASVGATEFYYLISGSENLDEQLPETKFLKKFKFVDASGRLIDKEGRLVTREGKHIDDYGNFIEWQKDGTSITVDMNQREIDGDGNFSIKFSPFLDDSGEPIEEEVPVKKKPAKKRKTKAQKAAEVAEADVAEAEVEGEADDAEPEAEVEAESEE